MTGYGAIADLLTPSRSAPARPALAAADPRLSREVLQSIHGERARIEPPGPPARLRLSRLAAASFGITELELRGAMTLDLRDHDRLIIYTLIYGSAYNKKQPLGPLFLGDFPGAGDRTLRLEDVRTRVVDLSLPLLAEVSGLATRPRRDPPRFLSAQPVDAAAGGRWLRTVEFVDELLTHAGPRPEPLLAANAARMLAASALSTFPSTLTAGDERTAADHTDATPAVLRRATAYIEACHGEPEISLADIAAAARATPRAVQYAFRRHLGTTPTAYLRAVRLARAHAELQQADAAGTSVMSVAARWGFFHAGRFAAYYAKTYGQPPSATLHA